MADKRKLQCDIDRTLKRIQEGRSSFQEILDKFESSGSQTQKEKFEADLKKEIKKLQRLRDQIKTWLTNNEIKDKRSLVDARKVIEQDMERFKMIEKETKTKAYSKEGLLFADAKKDPFQKEKEELDEWLKSSIFSLKTQCEKYEFELETLSHTGKKKRIDKEKTAITEEKKTKLAICSFHIEKLETVMRHLDNERLDCAKVRSVQEPVEYIIESIDDVGVEDYRNLYEDLHLEELGDLPKVPPPLNDQDNGTSIILPQSPLIMKNPDETPDISVFPIGSSTSSNASSSRERSKLTEDKLCATIPLITTSTPVKNNSDSNNRVGGNGSTLNVKSSKNSANHPSNQTAPSFLLNHTVTASSPSKNALGKSFAGSTNTSVNTGNVSSLLQPTDQSRLHSLSESECTVVKSTKSDGDAVEKVTETHRENYAKVASEHKSNSKSGSTKNNKDEETKFTEKSSSKTGTTPTPIQTPSKTEGKSGKHENISNEPSRKPTKEISQDATVSSSLTSPLVTEVISVATSVHLTPNKQTTIVSSCVTQSLSSLVSTTLPILHTAPSFSSVGKFPIPASSCASLSCNPSSGQQQKISLTMDTSAALQQANTVMAAVSQQHHQQQPRLSIPCVKIHPLDSAAPFRNRQLDKSKNKLPPELSSKMQSLENAYRRLPYPCETEKSRMILCKQPIFLPNSYPTEPCKGSDSEEYYMKLDTQTLFFLFYYFEGTKAQYLAAKALKRNSWRFHTKLMTWFQRLEEPKQITDEFESGTYIYYDFTTMSQRKKEEFVFHYSYLEDKDF